MATAEHPQATPARKKFLRLRQAVGLPPGGEIVHRHEVEMIARHLGVDYMGKTKPRIIFDVRQRVNEWRYGYRTRTWEEAQKGARDLSYLQSREAEAIARMAEEINEIRE